MNIKVNAAQRLVATDISRDPGFAQLEASNPEIAELLKHEFSKHHIIDGVSYGEEADNVISIFLKASKSSIPGLRGTSWDPSGILEIHNLMKDLSKIKNLQFICNTNGYYKLVGIINAK